MLPTPLRWLASQLSEYSQTLDQLTTSTVHVLHIHGMDYLMYSTYVTCNSELIACTVMVQCNGEVVPCPHIMEPCMQW